LTPLSLRCHPTYTTVQAVPLTFRRRLTAEQVLSFAEVLPPILRAIFVADRRPEERVESLPDRCALTEEVKALRSHHNFSPDASIAVVARLLRRHVDTSALDAVLSGLPSGAGEFWNIGPSES
jgi:uncharacterized protein (DUF2267 family)